MVLLKTLRITYIIIDNPLGIAYPPTCFQEISEPHNIRKTWMNLRMAVTWKEWAIDKFLWRCKSYGNKAGDLVV